MSVAERGAACTVEALSEGALICSVPEIKALIQAQLEAIDAEQLRERFSCYLDAAVSGLECPREALSVENDKDGVKVSGCGRTARYGAVYFLLSNGTCICEPFRIDRREDRPDP